MRQVPVSNIRLALITGIGSGLEYYAFITFAMQAQVLAQLFFHSSTASALIETFLVFALGSLITPVGGYILGAFGDQLGRKKMLLISIAMMTIATTLMGLLPTNLPFHLSIALLILLRLTQGISQGGELPGAITFIYEHAVKTNAAGLLSGLLFLGVGLGAGLSAGVNFWVHHVYTTEQVLAYAWRFPFLFAIVLGLAGYWLRRNTLESAIFLASKSSEGPLPLTKESRRGFLQGLALIWFPAVLVSLGLSLPSYLMISTSDTGSTIFLAMLFGFLSTALLLPIFGIVGDHIGRCTLFISGVILTMIALPFLFLLLKSPWPYALYLFNFIYYFLIVIMAACYPMILAQMFPTAFRYRLVALSYAGCYALASLTPFVASLMILHVKSPFLLLIFLGLSGMVSFIAGIKALLNFEGKSQSGKLIDFS